MFSHQTNIRMLINELSKRKSEFRGQVLGWKQAQSLQNQIGLRRFVMENRVQSGQKRLCNLLNSEVGEI